MKCPLPDEVINTVFSYLRRTRQAVVSIEGTHTLGGGIPNLSTVREAYRDGAIFVTEDGWINVCGNRIEFHFDLKIVRRRIEDHLRKSASTQEIIRVAACLGIKLK